MRKDLDPMMTYSFSPDDPNPMDVRAAKRAFFRNIARNLDPDTVINPCRSNVSPLFGACDGRTKQTLSDSLRAESARRKEA